MEQSYYFGLVALDAVLGLCIVCKNANVPVEPDGAVTYKAIDPLSGAVLATGALAPLPEPMTGVRYGQLTAAKSSQFGSQRNFCLIFSYEVDTVDKSIEGFFTVD